MIRKIGYVVVLALFVSSVAVLFPLTKEGWQATRSVKVYKYEHPTYTREKALKEIEARMVHLVTHRDSLTTQTVHQNLIFVNELLDGSYDEKVKTSSHELARLNWETHAKLVSAGKLDQAELSQLQNADPAWRSLRNPAEATIHWNILSEHAGKMIPFSFLFGILGFAGLVELWGFSKVLRVAYFTLTFLFSVSGGAIAQTIKKVDGKKKETSRTFQMDARVAVYVSEGPPTPGLFLRMTNSGKKGLVENVSTWNPQSKAWSTDAVGGLWVPGTGKTRVLGAGYLTDAKGARARIGLGLQIFRGGKRGLFALPVLRWERQLHGPPNHSFAIAPNPNIKLGASRWSIAPDLFARKVQGKPWAWQVGAGLRRTFGKHQLEVGWLRNQAGISQFRTRLISTYAY